MREMFTARETGTEVPAEGLPRWVEVPIALMGLLVLTPLLVATGLLIRATSGDPVLFRQARLGRGGSLFTLRKFRSMSAGGTGMMVTAEGDCRVTPFGKLLRRTKLDELPELWHVITGEMSLVGPRPEVPGLADVSDPAWREVLSVRPGLTDPVTLSLRNEEELLGEARERCGDVEAFYRDVLLCWKLKGYVSYLRVRTPWSDLSVLARTVTAVAGGRAPKAPTYDEIVRDAK